VQPPQGGPPATPDQHAPADQAAHAGRSHLHPARVADHPGDVASIPAPGRVDDETCRGAGVLAPWAITPSPASPQGEAGPYSRLVQGASLIGRFAAAIALTVGFYVLAVGLVCALVFLAVWPWTAGSQPVLLSITCVVLAGSILTAILPRR